jgi:hypothetical protein
LVSGKKAKLWRSRRVALKAKELLGFDNLKTRFHQTLIKHAPVAQMDRAMASGAIGYRFKSCRAYLTKQPIMIMLIISYLIIVALFGEWLRETPRNTTIGGKSLLLVFGVSDVSRGTHL